MAKRLTNRQADGARDAIQTGLLAKRLADHALNDAEMTQTQIRAAEILLNKTLPNLKVSEDTLTVEGDTNISVTFPDGSKPD